MDGEAAGGLTHEEAAVIPEAEIGAVGQKESQSAGVQTADWGLACG